MPITKEAIIRWAKEERDRLVETETEATGAVEEAKDNLAIAEGLHTGARDRRAAMDEVILLLEEEEK